MMNIDNERKDILEFRAYEMKKLLRILNNKVRSQKFTNQFIAYNAGMNEKELFSHMKYKPIKHDSYVRFFNSIVELISNHRGISKEELEENILKDIERDPLTAVNRISQIIEWNKVKEDHKELALRIKEELIDEKEEVTTSEIFEKVKEPVKTKDEMVNDIIIGLADLVDIDYTDVNLLNSINIALYNIVDKFEEPMLSFNKCLAMRNVIISSKKYKTSTESGLTDFLNELNKNIDTDTYNYFYPGSLPKIIMEKSLLDRITDLYIEYMSDRFSVNREKALQLLIDKEIEYKSKNKKYAKAKFYRGLIKSRRNNCNNILKDKPKRKNIFNLSSISPVSMNRFSEVILDMIRPYNERYLGYKLNEKDNRCSINTWIVIKAMHNIYSKMNIKYNAAYGKNNESVLNSLNNLAKKCIRRDIYARTAWSLYERIRMLLIYMVDIYDLEEDMCFGIIIEEIKKEAKLFNEDICQRLDLSQLKYFDQVIRHIFDFEPNDTTSNLNRKHTSILSKIVKDFITLVYNAIPSGLVDVNVDVKYTVGGSDIHPLRYIIGAKPLALDMYCRFIEEGLAQQIKDILDVKREDKNRTKDIADQLKAFIVYQVTHFPSEYGIESIELKEPKKIEEAKEPVIHVRSFTPYEMPEELHKVDAKFGACNFNSIEEAEDYIESLFEGNRRVDDIPEEIIEDEHIEETQEEIKEAEESIEEEEPINDNTNINKESEENMRKEFMEDYDERERDLFANGIRVGGRRREDIDEEDERERSRRRGGRGKSVGFRDLYMAIQVIEEYMKDPTINPNDKEDVADLIGSFMRRR